MYTGGERSGGANPQTIPHAIPRAPACTGFTLLEMLVVLTVILILTSAIISGYTTMQRNQRLSKATDKLTTTLNLAKNLAITNNSVTFVEITGDPLNPPQVLKIHVFPNPADGLKVTAEPAANTTEPNPFPGSTPASLVVLAPNAWCPVNWKSVTRPYVEPLSVAYTTGSPPTQIPGSGQAYNNYLVDTIPLENTTAAGIYPTVAGETSVLVGFNNDGSLLTAPALLYVTDDIKDLYLDDANLNATINDAAGPKFGQHLRAVRVFGGGIIKEVHR